MKHRTALTAVFLCLALSACATGFEGHNINLPHRPGTTTTIRIVWNDQAETTKACNDIIGNSEPIACASWANENTTADGLALLDGADCLVHSPLNSTAAMHELRHCIELDTGH